MANWDNAMISTLRASGRAKVVESRLMAMRSAASRHDIEDALEAVRILIEQAGNVQAYLKSEKDRLFKEA
jgi:hypothetical protein